MASSIALILAFVTIAPDDIRSALPTLPTKFFLNDKIYYYYSKKCFTVDFILSKTKINYILHC